MQRSHSQRRTQCITSPICLPVFSNQHLFQLTQDQEGLFKACNGAECKGVPFFSKPWIHKLKPSTKKQCNTNLAQCPNR
ncbi:hypothetical protein H5410_060746 [Solanum commersonii]|uniref:Uncharacterized protein n=1 Tax=Solanum commersonii TaxID=4109 RepID=A0A9J5W6Z0_SOLCO|nr:hypothetical protein H5410_060746 [Solanum commersonii]